MDAPASLTDILQAEVERVNAGNVLRAPKVRTTPAPSWFCKMCQQPIWRGDRKVRYQGLRTGNSRAETWQHDVCPCELKPKAPFKGPRPAKKKPVKDAGAPKQATAGILPWEYRNK